MFNVLRQVAIGVLCLMENSFMKQCCMDNARFMGMAALNRIGFLIIDLFAMIRIVEIEKFLWHFVLSRA